MGTKLVIFALFCMLPGLLFSWTDIGSNICTCGTNCSDCFDALNDTTNCTAEVRLTTALTTTGASCIYDPVNFNNKIFDCQGNTITGDDTYNYGIYLQSQSGNTIKNCNISDYQAGFYISSSNSNTFINNTASSNTWTGFYIRYSDNNDFFNNTASNNRHGVYYMSNSNNDMIDNNLSGNTQYDFYFYAGSTSNCNNRIENITGTGGLPINYTNTTVTWRDFQASQIILCNADNSVLSNLTANDFSIVQTENTLVNASLAANGYRGFCLEYSDSNNFTNNTAHSNSDSGFYAYYNSEGNIFTNNTAYSNRNGFKIESNAGNNFTNNTAYSNSFAGFGFGSYTEGNVLINNTARNNVNTRGFNLANTKHNLFINNTAHHNSYAINIERNSVNNTFIHNIVRDNSWGVYFDSHGGNINNTFINDSVYSNSNQGFSIRSAYNTSIISAILYDNYYGIHFSGSSAENLNMTNALFLNPQGTFVNYTNLSLYDVLGGTESYSINWTSPLAPPDADHIPFENKTVDITTQSGSPSIDSITWHWRDAEAGGYNESRLELWKYSGSWALVNDSPDNVSNTLMLYNHNPSSTYAIFENNASVPTGCMNFSHPGSYSLTQNAFGAPFVVNTLMGTYNACILINSSDVELDCNGYNITNMGSPPSTSAGVLAVGPNPFYTNITIRNCNVSGYDQGFTLGIFGNSTIENNTAHGNSDTGFYTILLRNTTIANNTAYSNPTGFEILFLGNYTISDNTASSNTQYGFYIVFANATLINNTASTNSDDGFAIQFANATLINNTASTNSDTGFTIQFANATLTNNTAFNSNTGFYVIFVNNATLTNNTAFSNTDDGFFIFFVNNATLTNNTAFSNTDDGFYIIAVNQSTLINNTAFSNDDGFYIFLSNSNNLTNNTAFSNTNGFYLLNSSNNNLTNNTAFSNYDGFYTVNSTNNTLFNNMAYGNTNNGFLIYMGNATLINNTAFANLEGFWLQYSSSTLINNTAFGQFDCAFIVFLSMGHETLINNTAFSNACGFIPYIANATFTNNTIHNNDEGLFIMDSQIDLFFNHTIFYNNLYDMEIFSFGSPLSYSAEELLFLNPSGTFDNYTNLSITDAVGALEYYFINWTSNATPLPADYSSLGNKYVQITNYSVFGPVIVSIENVTWHWNNTEASAFDESSLDIWKYNGSWQELNATLDTDANILTLLNLNPASDYGILGKLLPSEEKEKDKPPPARLSVEIALGCDMNVVTVTDDGEPVEGADVSVMNGGITSGTTDSNGEFSFEDCGYTAVVYVNKKSYSPKTITKELIYCAVCAGCKTDEDCQGCYYCNVANGTCMLSDDSQCAADVACAEGYICMDCSCAECIKDSDCPSGYTCEDYECVPPECFIDSDCPAGHICEDYDCIEEVEIEEPEPEVIVEEEAEEPEITPPLEEPSEEAVTPLAEPSEEEPEPFEALPAEALAVLAFILIAGIIYLIFSWRR